MNAALLGGHEGHDTLRLANEGAQVRRGVAKAKDPHAPDIRPHDAQTPADQTPGGLSDTAGIKTVKINDILTHAISLSSPVQHGNVFA
ncbi:hypothetical protein MACH01_30740 [Thalassospira tepidiphila]|nr:hypothetical protein MACH01_30740 [Thalassospira tepidiphila]